MKKTIFTFMMLIVLASCGSKQQPCYKTLEIKNTPYIVDVPQNMYIQSSEDGLLKLFRDESATGLAIMCTSMSVRDFHKKAREEIKQNEKNFSVNILEFSDSLVWYSFSKGKVKGNCFYSLKKAPYLRNVLYDEKIFIWYHGLGVTQEKANTIINSVRVNTNLLETTQSQVISDSMKVYSNSNFSISYPADWEYIVEHPAEMTEVLIRSEHINAGMTIVRIETEETLENIVQMSTVSNKQMDISTTTPLKLTISNCPAYKTEAEGVFMGDSIKQISYSLKDNNIFYNLRIGMNPQWVDKHKETIDKIISSFLIKQ